jgi:hypothetical protein
MQSFFAKFVLCAFALTLVVAATPVAAPAQIGITVSFGPPPIPYYEQPPAPQANWIGSPGYWQYDLNDGDYYWVPGTWVPGTWVPAPNPGYYWTPGYWAWNGDTYSWNRGYWATSVGYYGGVNYGYGYYGRGYVGGRWNGRHFAYNTAVTRVNRNVVRNVYVNNTVVVHTWNRVSYNGGRGGLAARATAAEMAVQRGRHLAPTPVQIHHQQYAVQNRAAFSRVNQGRPAAAAVARPYSRPQQAQAAPAHAAAPQRPAA